ncbi:energy-coupling factor transporter transmembrane protein EcfT [uncultured Oscillibacter sp.]|uniref:energy-coupling factor transporter transmembrane component T family protein n=1 Tax=uncultured Oscillibacter sp. TaxID=876091 RepID=UPI00260CC132|nr:energy-coupling factor transporter transmembrane component T [uncultured Oscillibacter sp.]
MVKLFNFIDRKSPIHALTGASKLACMMCWVFAAMVTFDTRYLIFLTLAAVVLFKISKIRLADVKVLLIFTLVFLLLNNALIYLFSPEHGVTIYGSRTLLFTIIGRYTITSQQLLYHLNVVLKYTATIPMVMLFICTTQPSEFASSLNHIGVSYRISYSVSLALRYIPDVMKEFHDISLAQQARGVELSGKAGVFKRLKSATNILMPLILSSLDRIEVVSNAMELRCFGREKTRTWYRAQPFLRNDYIAFFCGFLLIVISLLLNIPNGGRYWNPF